MTAVEAAVAVSLVPKLILEIYSFVPVSVELPVTAHCNLKKGVTSIQPPAPRSSIVPGTLHVKVTSGSIGINSLLDFEPYIAVRVNGVIKEYSTQFANSGTTSLTWNEVQTFEIDARAASMDVHVYSRENDFSVGWNDAIGDAVVKCDYLSKSGCTKTVQIPCREDDDFSCETSVYAFSSPN